VARVWQLSEDPAGGAHAFPIMIIYCNSNKSDFANQRLHSFLALSLLWL
jgi:hypothetical protein